MSSSSSAIFSGNSRFATDFQNVITRAVNIASLPITQLNNDLNSLNDQSTALTGFSTAFYSLQAAVTTLQNSTGSNSYSTSVSNGAIAQASVGAGATAGTYTLEVTSLGSLTSAMSNDGLTTVSDPTTQDLSSATDFTLTVNNSTYDIKPASTSLSSLMNAINNSGADVTASIVNVGSTSSPDYRLSIQGTKYRSDTIQLNDGSNDLLSTLTPGANASYKVNGLATAVQSDTRSITLAPGLTVNLLGQSATGVATTISVARDTTNAGNALSSFVTAYNNIVDQIDAQRGQAGGALAGDSIVNTLSSALHSLTSYAGSGTGAIQTLTDLGVTFDQTGKLSLDQSTLAAADPTAVLNFLGDGISSGFLKSADDIINSVTDSTNGTLTNAISSVQGQITSDNTAIANDQDKVDQLRDNLNTQMAAADAAIATLEQQVDYMTGLFSAMQTATQSLSK